MAGNSVLNVYDLWSCLGAIHQSKSTNMCENHRPRARLGVLQASEGSAAALLDLVSDAAAMTLPLVERWPVVKPSSACSMRATPLTTLHPHTRGKQCRDLLS
jgi:hypothetical protein